MDFFLFNIKGDPAWNEGTLYFYNGHTNQVRALAHVDENEKSFNRFTKTTTGMILHLIHGLIKLLGMYVSLER